MGDLIDFGKFAQTAIAFQNMQQNAQRMELMGESNAIDRMRLAEEQQAREQAWKTNQITLGTKLVDDPTVSLPDKARVYQFIAGVAGFPDLNPEQLLSAGDTLKKVGESIKNGDIAGRDQAVMELGYRFPKLALDQLNLIEKTQGLNEKALEHKQKLELGQAKLQEIEERSATLKSTHEVYAPLSMEMRAQLQTFGTPGVRLYGGEFGSADARNAFLAMNPDAKKIVDTASDSRFMAYEMMNQSKKDLAYWQAQQAAIDRGESTQNPAVVSERVTAFQKAVNARQAQYDFFSDLSDMKMGRGNGPDKKKYDAFVQAQRDMEESAKVAQKGLRGLADERLAFMETKADKKELQDTAQNFANLEFLRALQAGGDPQAAAIAAADSAQKKYGVIPDASKFKDPKLTGQQTVTLLSPAERTNIAEERTLVGQLDNLIKNFDPAYVGSIDSRMGRVGQMTGTLSAKREMWLQEGRAFLSEARHKIFGASLTAGEQEAALNELPNDSMGDKQWPAAAKAWRDKWGRLIEERLRVANQSKGILPGQQNRPPIVLPQGYVDQQSLKQELLKDYQ